MLLSLPHEDKQTEASKKTEQADFWTCKGCTFENFDVDALSCGVCGGARPLLNDRVKFAFIIDMIGGPPTDPNYGFIFSITDDIAVKEWKQKLSDLKDVKFSFASTEDAENCLIYSDSRYFATNGYSTVLLCNATLKKLPEFYHNEGDKIEVIDWNYFTQAVDLSERILRFKAYDIES